MLPAVTFRLEGQRLVADSDAPLTNDQREFIREHKAEILAELERRRRRDEVLLKLSDNPGVKYAYVVDSGSDPVILAVGIRDLATFEMAIPVDRYDPFRLMTFLVEADNREGT